MYPQKKCTRAGRKNLHSLAPYAIIIIFYEFTNFPLARLYQVKKKVHIRFDFVPFIFSRMSCSCMNKKKLRSYFNNQHRVYNSQSYKYVYIYVKKTIIFSCIRYIHNHRKLMIFFNEIYAFSFRKFTVIVVAQAKRIIVKYKVLRSFSLRAF